MDDVIDIVNTLNNEDITSLSRVECMIGDAKQLTELETKFMLLEAKYDELYKAACEVHCFVEGHQERMALYKDDFINLRKGLLALRRAKKNS